MEHNKLVGCIRAYIRNAIAATGMSNDDFRSAFGNLSHKTLRIWLNGQYLPTLNNLLRIEALSGVSLDGSGIRIHSALVCMQEILAAAQRGVPIKHIAVRCDISNRTLNAMIEHKNVSVMSLLTAYENWVANDCARWFASEDYALSLVKQKQQKKPTQDEAVAHWVYYSFGPEIAKSLTSPQDGLWEFETDSMYKCIIEHMDGFEYRFRAIWKPKDRVSVERVIEIA